MNQAKGGLLVAIVLPAIRGGLERSADPKRLAWTAAGRTAPASGTAAPARV